MRCARKSVRICKGMISHLIHSVIRINGLNLKVFIKALGASCSVKHLIIERRKEMENLEDRNYVYIAYRL